MISIEDLHGLFDRIDRLMIKLDDLDRSMNNQKKK